MKIIYHHRIASKDGQFVHIEEIVSALEEQNHSVIMLSPGIAESGDFGHDGGFVAGLKQKLPKFVYELLELGYSAIAAFKLVKSILKDRPDFIYERYNLYQPAGVLVGKLFKIPVLLEVNAPLKEEREKYCGGLALPKLAKFIENLTWLMASHTLPVTKELAKHLVQAGVPQDRITVIHNGIREGMLNEASRSPVRVSEEINIGFVGFMNLTCGVHDAISVIAKHKDLNVKLTCVGNGDEAVRLKQLAKDLGVSDRVLFTGLLPRTEVFECVKGFDIALQPAVTAYASPLKMFEYMLSKCLIVAPKSANILEILSDDTAVLFGDKDGDFSNALEFALENFKALTTKREAAYSSLKEKKFVWQENTKKITSIASKL
jgi:glycosyltransferase involved in cell wall biosynthesis